MPPIKPASELQCPPAKEARPGDTVTLRFLMKPGTNVNKDLTVECLHWDADTNLSLSYYLYRQGTVDVFGQEERFKGKTDLWLKESSSGKFSLKTKADYPGTYTCNIYDDVENNSCSTTLTVGEEVTTTLSSLTRSVGISDPVVPGMDPGAIWGTIATIGGIIIVAGIFFYIKKRYTAMMKRRVDPNAAPKAEASSGSESSM